MENLELAAQSSPTALLLFWFGKEWLRQRGQKSNDQIHSALEELREICKNSWQEKMADSIGELNILIRDIHNANIQQTKILEKLVDKISDK